MKTSFYKILSTLGAAIALLSCPLLSAHEFTDYGQDGEWDYVSNNVKRGQFGLAIGTDGEPVVCFIEVNNDSSLSFAKASTNWSPEAIEANLDNSDECALLMDGDIPHIIYTKKGTNKLKHATKVDGVWNTEEIADNLKNDNAMNFIRSFSASFSPDKSKLGVAYYDGQDKDLEYAEYDGENWTTTTLTSMGEVGAYASLAFKQDNQAIVSYVKDASTTPTLWLIEEDGDVWGASQQIIDEGASEMGEYCSIAVDPQNRVHLSYRVTKEDTSQPLHYRIRNELGEWSDPLNVSSHEWNWSNAISVRMFVDADGNAFFLHNWEFVSGLFPDYSAVELISVYFLAEAGSDSYAMASDAVVTDPGNNFFYQELAISMDENYNAYVAWIAFPEVWEDDYTLHVKQISSWTPAAVLLTPNAEENEVAENTFTFSWLDFAPDSNAYLRISWRDENWEYHTIATTREDGANFLEVAELDLPSGEFPIGLYSSSAEDFSTYSLFVSNTLLSVPEQEDEPELQDEGEDEDAGDDNVSDENEEELNQENSQNDSSDENSDDSDESNLERFERLAIAAAVGGCQLNQTENSPESLAFFTGLGFFTLVQIQRRKIKSRDAKS